MPNDPTKTEYQGFEIANPSPPSNSNGTIVYPEAPSPVDIAGKPITVVLSADALSEEELRTLIDQHYKKAFLDGHLDGVTAFLDAGKLLEKIKKGDFSDLPKWLKETNHVELAGSLQWVQAADPQSNPTSEESSVQLAFESGVTSSESDTKSFAISIGVSVSAGYGPMSATLTTSFTSSHSSTHGVSIEKKKTETHEMPIPANSVAQIWQLQITFENKTAGKSITTQGPILPLYASL